MFWTAFIWGLGVSCGACFGLLLFFILKAGLDWLLNTRAIKEVENFARLNLDALNRRNDLTDQQVDQLASIAHSLSIIADPGGDDQ